MSFLKKEVGITKVTKLADLEDIALHYKNMASPSPAKKLKLSAKISATKQVVSEKKKHEEIAPVAMEKNLMEFPDEILMKIMGYFSTEDILKKMALVSKKFYGLSRDQNIIKKIDFKTPYFLGIDYIRFEYPKTRKTYLLQKHYREKYLSDFLEVLKNARNLKFLSLYINNLVMQKSCQIQPSVRSVVNRQFLQEFLIQFHSEIPLASFIDYLKNVVFKVLDGSPKLKILKIEGLEPVSLVSHGLNLILKTIARFNSESLQELHLKIKAEIWVADQNLLIQYLKNFLNVMTENKPNIQYLRLDMKLWRMDIKKIKESCQEIASKKKIKIEFLDVV